jgi:5-methylcytosine-specific restriction endonuclease McrA
VGRRVKYTREVLEEAVAKATSVAGVLRQFGLKEAGGNYANINRWIRFYEIDISHFRGMAHQKGLPAPNRLHWSEVLTVAPVGSNRRETARLRRALLESGRPHECENCGSDPEWLGAPLALHVDHIDGNSNDSRPENLRFLCPNCHSQTPTWARRSRHNRPTETLDPAPAASSAEAEAGTR